MPVVAIINRKGGSGKTTLATHVAAWLSRRGDAVMLGDVDRQQSAVPWIKRRQARAPGGAPLVGWALDARNVLRPPAGVRYVVLDTPGGLHGFSLSRLLMNVDVVLMPVCDSVFDRESASACLAEVRMHPRVAAGRVQLAMVGMRLDPESRAEPRLRLWAEERAVPLVGALQEARAYARVAERGLTLFDRSPGKVQSELKQWEPVLDWLDAALEASSRTTAAGAMAQVPGSVAAAGAQAAGRSPLRPEALVPQPAPMTPAVQPQRAAPSPTMVTHLGPHSDAQDGAVVVDYESPRAPVGSKLPPAIDLPVVIEELEVPSSENPWREPARVGDPLDSPLPETLAHEPEVAREASLGATEPLVLEAIDEAPAGAAAEAVLAEPLQPVLPAAAALETGPVTEAGPATVFPGDLMRPLAVPPLSVRLRLWARRWLSSPGLGRSKKFGR